MALDEKRNAKYDEVAFDTPTVQPPAFSPEDPGPGPVSEEERRLVRKLDRRILPIACLMYLFACQ